MHMTLVEKPATVTRITGGVMMNLSLMLFPYWPAALPRMCTLFVVVLAVFMTTPGRAQDGAQLNQMHVGAATPLESRFEYDPSWPQMPLPNNWMIGTLTGVAVDQQDLIWIVHHPWSLNKPMHKGFTPAPPVIAFDKTGKVAYAWGGPGEGYDWPGMEHGIFVDYKGNVWVGGQSGFTTAKGGLPPRPYDGQILKFSREGKILMQIGGPGPGYDNSDINRLAGASDMVVDPETNEVLVADGYDNNRVVVFDADTGAFKRMWGAFGKPPKRPVSEDAEHTVDGKAQQFNLLHCIGLSHDGLVYVCDRGNSRIQVFKKEGTFVTQFIGNGPISDIGFSPDKQQKMLAITAGNGTIRLLRRSDGQAITDYGSVGIFGGQLGWLHQLAVDGLGNIYTSEALGRVQRFEPKNHFAWSSDEIKQ